jgi:hypothetical protein
VCSLSRRQVTGHVRDGTLAGWVRRSRGRDLTSGFKAVRKHLGTITAGGDSFRGRRTVRIGLFVPEQLWQSVDVTLAAT